MAWHGQVDEVLESRDMTRPEAESKQPCGCAVANNTIGWGGGGGGPECSHFVSHKPVSQPTWRSAHQQSSRSHLGDRGRLTSKLANVSVEMQKSEFQIQRKGINCEA